MNSSTQDIVWSSQNLMSRVREIMAYTYLETYLHQFISLTC